MSNEPLTTLSATQPSTPEPSTDAAPTDRAADVAMMLAAVERMETVMRGERAAFERLRADLGDMASTVALAKAALASFAIKPDDAGNGKASGKSGDVTALLQAIENRIGAMTQVIDGANVDAGNDGGVTQPPAAAVEPAVVEEPQAVAAAEVAPSVAMLDSMVEAMPMAMPEFAPPEPQLEAPVVATEDSMPVEAAAPPTTDPAMPDIDLMASFAQVEAMPVLRGEIGTAVIFAPKEPEAAPPVEVQAAPEPAVEAAMQSPEAAPEAPAEATLEAAPAIIAATPIEAPIEPAVETAAELPLASADDEDPAEFLYEPDPDPAADLLEPIDFAPQPKPTPPASAAILPTLAPAVASTVVPSPIAPSQPKPMLSPERTPMHRPPATPTVPHDPLAPLKSMSDEEKIALFS